MAVEYNKQLGDMILHIVPDPAYNDMHNVVMSDAFSGAVGKTQYLTTKECEALVAEFEDISGDKILQDDSLANKYFPEVLNS